MVSNFQATLSKTLDRLCGSPWLCFSTLMWTSSLGALSSASHTDPSALYQPLVSVNAMGDRIQSPCDEKRFEVYRLSLTRKVCYQVSRENQTGLRKSGLDKPPSPVTFQRLAELFWSEMNFSLLLYNFQDPSFPLNHFFKRYA